MHAKRRVTTRGRRKWSVAEEGAAFVGVGRWSTRLRKKEKGRKKMETPSRVIGVYRGLRWAAVSSALVSSPVVPCPLLPLPHVHFLPCAGAADRKGWCCSSSHSEVDEACRGGVSTAPPPPPFPPPQVAQGRWSSSRWWKGRRRGWGGGEAWWRNALRRWWASVG